MKALTVNIREDQSDFIEEISGEGGEYDSKSEAIRSFIDGYEEVSKLQKENERLQRERRQLLEQREEHTQLVKYIEEEQSYRKAGLGARMKWWLFGMDE